MLDSLKTIILGNCIFNYNPRKYFAACGTPPDIERATLMTMTAPYFENEIITYECNNQLVNAEGIKTFTYTCSSQGMDMLEWVSDLDPPVVCNREYKYLWCRLTIFVKYIIG